MSIPLFAYDANPRVDRPLCHKSREQAVEMLREGRTRVLRNEKGKEWAIQFVPILEHTLAAQLSAFLATSPDLGAGATADELLDLFESSNERSTAAISDGEMRANVGDAENAAQILRARVKVKTWPLVGDERAIRVGCRA